MCVTELALKVSEAGTLFNLKNNPMDNVFERTNKTHTPHATKASKSRTDKSARLSNNVVREHTFTAMSTLYKK